MIRFSIFFSGVAVLLIGFLGQGQMERESGFAFVTGTMTLGGGFLICGVFSIKMLWHGVIGAGVLALLGAGRGLLNLGDLAKYFVGERERGGAPPLEFAVLLVCVFLLMRVLHVLARERTRRMLAE